MPRYNWTVDTYKVPGLVRSQAKAKYRAARDAWQAMPIGQARADAYPRHTLEECAWVATISGGGWTAQDGGSSERVAVERAARNMLRAAKKE